MKLHYQGKYNGDEASLPHSEHRPGAVKFREAESKKLSIIANAGALIVAALLFVPFLMRAQISVSSALLTPIWIGGVLFLLSVLPHELLHACCFRGDVYLYTWLSRGLVFVTGPEDMSKARFIFMSLLPNLVFGVLPFSVFLMVPRLAALGAFGVFAISAGFGDYINVFNALRQMPKGARTYLYGFHSYWYQP